ncbi:integrase [Salinadaptatus halalkaliphilus]|uniref:Integrase n=2 Tax=Salinadaptatus halalkaliphilus TaxID=2419781 RepID=A0A4S3TKA3_9EURY|nr:integrase [Salinadaptatus halalkaliphilus]
MTGTPEEKYESKKGRLWGRDDTFEKDGLVQTGEVTEPEAEAIQELCDAFDPEKLERQEHIEKKKDFEVDKQNDKSYSTLWGWMYRLSRISRDLKNADFTADTLLEVTPKELNDLMERGYYNGEVPNCSGMTKSTVRTYQFALRIFYRYHSDLEIDPQSIGLFSEQNDSAVDPDDMLTQDEIEAMKNAAEHPRDFMIFMLALYTGMRDTALRTLRVKDVKHLNDEHENGKYRFNPNVDHGLKGADDRNGWRPLLLAEGAVRQWLNSYHPGRHRDDFEDCYVVTAKPNYGYVDPTDSVSNSTIRRTLRKIAEKAEVDKPINPHAMRHNFVTICKRDYDLDNDTIKWLIGHTKDSRVMETTYSHLSDKDFSDNAEEAFDLKEEEERSTLTPKRCTCGTKVEPGAKACSNCGMIFAPDAQAAQREAKESVKEGYKHTDPDDDETMEELEAIDEALDDPEVMSKLVENDDVMDKIAGKVAEKMADE